MTEGLYTIENFDSQLGKQRNQYGPTIILAKTVVGALLQLKLKRSDMPKLETELIERIVNSVGYGDRPHAHLKFYEDTWLLMGMHVGAECACLGVENSTKVSIVRGDRPAIRYAPHNIGSAQQSAAVLSTWLHWFNNVISLTTLRQPYTF